MLQQVCPALLFNVLLPLQRHNSSYYLCALLCCFEFCSLLFSLLAAFISFIPEHSLHGGIFLMPFPIPVKSPSLSFSPSPPPVPSFCLRHFISLSSSLSSSPFHRPLYLPFLSFLILIPLPPHPPPTPRSPRETQEERPQSPEDDGQRGCRASGRCCRSLYGLLQCWHTEPLETGTYRHRQCVHAGLADGISAPVCLYDCSPFLFSSQLFFLSFFDRPTSNVYLLPPVFVFLPHFPPHLLRSFLPFTLFCLYIYNYIYLHRFFPL
jgi:hypothetical protein